MGNLYTIIGVSKDATSAQIKAAYRKLCQTMHPDAGGDPERLTILERAKRVLLDPARRDAYDARGEVDDSASNAQAVAISIASQLLNEIISELMATGRDPETLNLLKLARTEANSQTNRIANENDTLAESILKAKGIGRRMKGKGGSPNLLGGLFDEQVRRLEQHKAANERQIESLRAAVALIDAHEFEAEQEAEPKPKRKKVAEIVSESAVEELVNALRGQAGFRFA